MRRALLLIFAILATPLATLAGQNSPLKRTLIVSFVTSNMAIPAKPVFDRQRIYYILRPDTLVLYDIVTRMSRQIGVGQWSGLSVSPNGDFLAFSRVLDGTRVWYVWTLPLDPATGVPSGPPRRASMGPGNNPSISPDGKWIAFSADSEHKTLAVIPSSGGRERDLLKGPGDFWGIEWTTDGTELYFACTHPGNDRRDAVKKIAVSGGPAVMVSDEDLSLDGISVDGAHLITDENAWPNDGPIVLDTLGHRVIPTALDSTYSTVQDRLTSSSVLERNSFRRNGLKSLSVNSGQSLDLLPWAAGIESVAWSPDGSRFAAIRSAKGQSEAKELVFATPEASVRRAVPMPDHSCCYRVSWAPNGRSIAVLTYGQDLPHVLIIDPATSATRQLRTSGIIVDNLSWTADSRAVRYFSGERADSGYARTVREAIPASGSDRVIRELPRPFNASQSVFASDTTAIIVTDTSAFVASLTGSAFRPLISYQGGKPTISPRGDLIVVRPPQREATGGARHNAEVLTPTGQHVATVTFPGIIGFGVQDHFVFTPDQRSIIGSGRDGAGNCCVLYQGFLDGTPSRIIGDAPSIGAPRYSLSPDGKTLLYTAAGPWITTFTSIDVAGALRRPRQ